MATSPSTLPAPSLEDVWNGTISLSEYTMSMSQERQDQPKVLESDAQVSESTNQQAAKALETKPELEHTHERPDEAKIGAKENAALPPGRLPIGTLPQPRPVKEKPPTPLQPGPLGSGSKK